MTGYVFTQTLVSALVLSLLYILVAIGLTWVFSIMRMINFAHGELYMLGGYAVYLIYSLAGVNYWIAVIASFVLMGLVGVLLYRGIFRPLSHDILGACIASLGVGLMLSNAMMLIIGGMGVPVETIVKGTVGIFGAYVSWEKLVTIAIAAAIAAGVMLFINRTKMGQALQALSQDADAASLQGINVERLTLIGFAIACALGGAAGGLVAPLFSVNPWMGGLPILKAFIVVIVGGLGSIPGAIIAGFMLGLIDQFSLALFGYVGHVVGFAIVMAIMVFRPRGLLGREFRVH